MAKSIGAWDAEWVMQQEKKKIIINIKTININIPCHIHMGVSENSVPLNPMVNDHYAY
jgi:hypothetical protein